MNKASSLAKTNAASVNFPTAIYTYRSIAQPGLSLTSPSHRLQPVFAEHRAFIIDFIDIGCTDPRQRTEVRP